MTARVLRDDRGPFGLSVVGFIVCVAVLVAWVCGALMVLTGSQRASATPSAPLFIGETASGEVPGGLGGDLGIAVDQASGDMYVSQYGRVDDLSPYGNLIRTFGREVDKTEVERRKAQEEAKEPVTVTPEQEEICTAASHDDCSNNNGGSLGGQFARATGVAVEQSTGDVYVVDRNNHRVQKFDSSGHFILAFGMDVNKVKAEAVAAKEANSETPTATELKEANRCLAAETCQEGRTGTGEGAFEAWPFGSFIAVGGPSEHIYVGDKGRVQVFNKQGEYVEAISLASLSASAKVTALAIDASGDLYLTDQGVAGVHEIEVSGTLSSTVFDAASTSTSEVALDGSGHLYVGDKSPSFRVLEYEIASPSALPAEFAGSEPGKVYSSEALAVNRAGAVDLLSNLFRGQGSNAVKIYGTLVALEGAYGAPSSAPTISSESVAATPGEAMATLQAQVNPQFRETTYQFQYGTEPCGTGHCTTIPATPASLGSVTKTEHQALATITGLQLGAVYHYRVLATSPAGTAEGAEQLFTVDSALVAGPTGLPDERVFEQVSPPYKNGNFVDFIHPVAFGLAEAGGDAVVYPMSGAVGSAYGGTIADYVSRRTPGVGWSTEQTVPRQSLRSYSIFNENPFALVPSAAFTKFLFASATTYVKASRTNVANIYLSESPAGEPDWLARPTVSNPIPAIETTKFSEFQKNFVIAGASPDLSTVYFAYAGTLLPEDSARAPHIGDGTSDGSHEFNVAPWGFYEWNGGALREAGTLPNGSLSPYGAVPAAMGLPGVFGRQEEFQATNFDNWLSQDGDRALFLSPDPLASTVTSDGEYACRATPIRCTSEPPELYLREMQANGGHKVTLVSRSELPGHEGQPAPTGPVAMNSVSNGKANAGSFAFASPDGSHVFFASADRLTTAAPEGAEIKEYEYDVQSSALTYLPGVLGTIVAASREGSDFLFVDEVSSPGKLELWRRGAGGGAVSTIAELPVPHGELGTEVRYAHVSPDGSVVLFDTNSQLPGGFNNGGEDKRGNSPFEVYRYDVALDELKCLSCPPKGVTPVGDAFMSYNNYADVTEEVPHPNGSDSDPQTTLEPRGMSVDGDRVFFDTPNALVPQAINGVRNVYEWENGKTYLLSSGSSTEPSYYLDNSESGGDVFFVTQAGLVPGDTDEAYDVYDARIPRPGDNPPPTAVPCKGSICQGPPNVPQLLGEPASATFNGLGNVTSPVETTVKAKPKKKTKSKKKPKKRVKKARKTGRSSKRVKHGKGRGK